MDMNVRVESLSFRYAGSWVFVDWSHNFKKGLTWLRGSNGKGKTTLLKMLGGAIEPISGKLRVAGYESSECPLEYRRNVFLCVGETPDFPWLKMHELFSLYCSIYKRMDLSELQKHVVAFGLEKLLGHSVSELSLGQHKKMQLAVAMSLNVEVLLLDEPFNGLDHQSLDYFKSVIAEKVSINDATVIITSHLNPELNFVEIINLDNYALVD